MAAEYSNLDGLTGTVAVDGELGQGMLHNDQFRAARGQSTRTRR